MTSVSNAISEARQPRIGVSHSSQENRITRIVIEIMAFIANLSHITHLQFVVDYLNAKNRKIQDEAVMPREPEATPRLVKIIVHPLPDDLSIT